MFNGINNFFQSDKLWDKSRLTKKYNDFYVEGLKLHFLPSDQQVETTQSAVSAAVLSIRFSFV